MIRSDRTPINMQAPSIPVLTDLVSRGAKAPAEAVITPENTRPAATAPEPIHELASEDLIGVDPTSEDPTVYPDDDNDPTPQAPEAAFSLDELTEPPAVVPAFSLDELTEPPLPPADDDPQVNDLVEQAMAQLMPELEKTARGLLKDLLEAENKQNGRDEQDSSD